MCCSPDSVAIASICVGICSHRVERGSFQALHQRSSRVDASNGTCHICRLPRLVTDLRQLSLHFLHALKISTIRPTFFPALSPDSTDFDEEDLNEKFDSNGPGVLAGQASMLSRQASVGSVGATGNRRPSLSRALSRTKSNAAPGSDTASQNRRSSMLTRSSSSVNLDLTTGDQETSTFARLIQRECGSKHINVDFSHCALKIRHSFLHLIILSLSDHLHLFEPRASLVRRSTRS